MLAKEFSSEQEYLYETKDRKQTIAKHENMLKLLKGYINEDSKVLDVGERNPLTEKIELAFGVKIDNTIGDLDSSFVIPWHNYDVVICSHVIEHIFNPLYMLRRLTNDLESGGVLIVALPQRGKLLWTKVHYHEIDDYRIRVLFRMAGFRVVKKIREKVKRQWWFYLTGLRPLLRLFLEYNAIYILRKL